MDTFLRRARRRLAALLAGVAALVSQPRSADAQSLPFALANPEASYPKDLAVDPATGDLFVALYFGGTVDFDPGPGVAARTAAGFIDHGLARYAPDGTLRWAIHWGTGAMSAEIPHALEVDAAGAIYVGGYFTATGDFDPGPGVAPLTSNGDRDAYLVKFTPAGEFVWARGFGGPGSGETAWDQGWGLDVAADGRSVQAGFFQGTTNDLDPGPGTTTLTSAGGPDAFVVRRDAAGALEDALVLGAAGDDSAMAVRWTAEGGFVVAGHFSGTVDFDPGAGTTTLTSAGNTDIFVARYDAAGALVGAFRLGGVGFDAPIPGGLMFGGNGDLLVCGSFQASVDFDPGPAAAVRVSSGLADVFIAHYAFAGAAAPTLRWAIAWGGPGVDGAHRMVLDAADDVFATGYFSGSPDVDPGPGVATLAARSGGTDLFVASYTAAGALRWASGFGDPAVTATDATSLGTGIDLDGRGRVLVTGPFHGSIDFDPGPGEARLTSAGDTDAVVVAFDAATGALAAGAAGGAGLLVR